MVTLQTHSPPNGRGETGVAELGESPGLLNSPSAQVLQTSPWNLAILCYLPLNLGCLGCRPCCKSWPCPNLPCALFLFIALTFQAGPTESQAGGSPSGR